MYSVTIHFQLECVLFGHRGKKEVVTCVLEAKKENGFLKSIVCFRLVPGYFQLLLSAVGAEYSASKKNYFVYFLGNYTEPSSERFLQINKSLFIFCNLCVLI